MSSRLPSLRSVVPLAAVALAGLVVGACGSSAARGGSASGAGNGTVLTRPLASTTASDTSTASTGLTVAGIGRVEGTPDLLTVDIGVHTTAARAVDALADNNRRTADLLATFKSSGVDPKDLQTSQLSLSPSYNNTGLITGYQVDNTVTAKLRDLSRAGALIDAAAAKVGDAVRIEGIAFSIDNTSSLYAAARQAAVADARSRANDLAAAAGVKIGAVRSITDTTDTNPPLYGKYNASAAGVPATTVPVEPGTQSIEVQVSMVFDLVP